MSRLALVALGGALGAVSRYLVSGWTLRLFPDSSFPWGTLVVNVAGSFLLGLLVGLGAGGRSQAVGEAWLFLGVGFLGALTTFSTFSYEAIDALRGGQARLALAQVTANLVGALLACLAGFELGERC